MWRLLASYLYRSPRFLPLLLPCFVFTAHVKLTTNVEHMLTLPWPSLPSSYRCLSPSHCVHPSRGVAGRSRRKFHSMSVQLHARFPLPAASVASQEIIKNALAKQMERERRREREWKRVRVSGRETAAKEFADTLPCVRFVYLTNIKHIFTPANDSGQCRGGQRGG